MKRSWWIVLALGGLVVIVLLAVRLGRGPSRPAGGPPPQAQKPAQPQPGAPVPIGRERTAQEWSADVSRLLFDRRVTAAELVGGLGGIAFDPSKCKACHGNPSPVGLVFYGPENKDFAKDQWLPMLGRPEKGEAPAKDYDWIGQHKSRVELRYDVFPEAQIRQNP